MMCQIVDRGPDSAGLAVYNTPGLVSKGTSTLSLLGKDQGMSLPDIKTSLESMLPATAAAAVRVVGDTTLVSAAVGTDLLVKAASEALPAATIIGRGEHVAVMKGTGHPMEIAAEHGLEAMAGSQGLSHTRMATESAVTAGGSHPFSVADDLCLVHNGSFSNHATIRRSLLRQGVVFDSDNDTEVGARYIASRLQQGDDLETALTNLGKVFDGFYTLVVTTADSMAVVRDPIACKPAIIAETADYVAMASEYRALASLPGIETARIFEPEPGKVYTWSL
jgi:glutamate synthase domain-containing protein 1